MNSETCRPQRTIARPVEVQGVGFITGVDVRLRFVPAPPSTGVIFVRTDLRPQVRIPAQVDHVTSTARRTVLGQAPAHVGLVEHVLAALAGLRIDNCVIELNAPEPPGLDGSARAFVTALTQAGIALQPAQRPVWRLSTSVVVTQPGATLAAHPTTDDVLRVSYLLDYGIESPIHRQTYTEIITPERFASEVAPCRTFLLEGEAEGLRRQGIGRSTTTADLLVFGKHGPIGNRLRHANEPARHKVLDVIGDLSLLGYELRAHVVAYRSGHQLNVDLVRALREQMRRAGSSAEAA